MIRSFLPALALALAAPLALPAGLSAEAPVRILSGEVLYRERIALPEDAQVVVELRDDMGLLLGAARFASGGRQVPIDYAVTVPPGVGGMLRAGIFQGARPGWVSAGVPVAAGEADVELPPLLLQRHVVMGFASALDCGAERAEIGFVDEVARLRIRGEVLDLLPVPAASGARFVAADDPGTSVHTRGDHARITLRGEELAECMLAVPPALLPLEARGNEPFWFLAMTPDRLVLRGIDGVEIDAAWEPHPEEVSGGVALAGPEALEILLREDICRDTMTGMPYPYSVAISRDGKVREGCGGTPERLLVGFHWRVTDIGGAAPGDGVEVSIVFGEDGGISGRAACNRYAGRWTLGGEGLGISPLASTKMACPPALMEVEGRMLAMLPTIDRFDIDDEGALVLLSADRPVLRALPARPDPAAP